MCRRSSLHDLVSAVAQLREEVRRCRSKIGNLQSENEILREAAEPLIHQAAARERFAFIRTRRDRFSVKLLCRVLATDGGNPPGRNGCQWRHKQRKVIGRINSIPKLDTWLATAFAPHNLTETVNAIAAASGDDVEAAATAESSRTATASSLNTGPCWIREQTRQSSPDGSAKWKSSASRPKANCAQPLGARR
jgi:hypothetical protein